MNEADRPNISVVIPAYNRAHTVGRAIRSVLNQTYQDWELIVVDDGSVDETDRAIKQFNDKRLRYLRHHRNRGQSAAQNTALEAAHGKYIAFLDSDDEWLPEKLAKEVALFEASGGEVGLVYSGKMLINETGRVLKVRIPCLEGNVYDKLLAWDFIGSCSRVSVRKEILDSVGHFDEQLANCQDWDVWLKVARVSRVGFVPECLVKRHFGSDQVSGSLRRIWYDRARMVDKYRDKMPGPVLGKHLGNLAIIAFNYDPPRARQMAAEALKLRSFQPTLVTASAASLLGMGAYRWLFSKLARLRHGFYVGRAAI
jgi:glycosyltransferase involved in cell wall biosynthesis